MAVTDATLAVDSLKPAIDPTIDPLIDFEAAPEFRQQFQTWKESTLKEVQSYLRTNWNEEVTLDRLAMTGRFEFPDRENRFLWGQVAPGRTFTNLAGEIVPHPVSGEPMIFAVWRKINPPPPVQEAETLEPKDTVAETSSVE